MPDDIELDDSDRRLLHSVQTYGWHAVFIEDDEPSEYVFSLGLMHTEHHPELVGRRMQ